jgi:hypothetical protein
VLDFEEPAWGVRQRCFFCRGLAICSVTPPKGFRSHVPEL